MQFNINDIPELNKDYVHIRNKQELEGKIRKLIEDGSEKLQIVTDFDLTLTKFKMENGDTGLRSWDMFWGCPSIPSEVKVRSDEIAKKYRPQEEDATIPREVKVQLMVDWYNEAHALLRGIKFPRVEMEERARKITGKAFRQGVADVMRWAHESNVPVLVFSAGQGDSVMSIMQAAGFAEPNVKVVSNFLDLDADNNIVGLKSTIIHTLNKNDTVIRNTDYYESVRARTNVLLVGDNDGDADMADGIDSNVVIKIGINGRGQIEENMPVFLEKFDIVLVGDPSFEVVQSILNLLN